MVLCQVSSSTVPTFRRIVQRLSTSEAATALEMSRAPSTTGPVKLLRYCYAVSGTDLVYAPTTLLRRVRAHQAMGKTANKQQQQQVQVVAVLSQYLLAKDVLTTLQNKYSLCWYQVLSMLLSPYETLVFRPTKPALPSCESQYQPEYTLPP
eukprot:1216350-Rhodomonas_salina.1